MFEAHIRTSADITVGVLPVPKEDCAGFGILLTASDGQIRAFREKPRTDEELAPLAPSKDLRERWGLQPGQYLASMGVYIFRMETLRESLATPENMDFGKDILPRLIGDAQGPGVPVPGLLEGHRDDPELLRGEHRAHGRRPAVPLLPPRRADLHARALPSRLVAHRGPHRPLPPRRRREDLRRGDHEERHRPARPDREGVPDHRVDRHGRRRHRGGGQPRRRPREGDPAGRDRRRLRHREGDRRQERPDRRGMRPPGRPVAPGPGRRRLVRARRDRHRPEERGSSSPAPSSEEPPGGDPGRRRIPRRGPRRPSRSSSSSTATSPPSSDTASGRTAPTGSSRRRPRPTSRSSPPPARSTPTASPWKATIGLTPVLCEQLTDPRFVARVPALRRGTGSGRGARRPGVRPRRRTRPSPRRGRGGTHYEAALALFDGRSRGTSSARFARARGRGEGRADRAAATHGFLPLLPSDAAAERQLDVGLAAHRRHFGRPAARPLAPGVRDAARGDARDAGPREARRAARRPLPSSVRAGIRFTFVETHLVAGRAGPARVRRERRAPWKRGRGDADRAVARTRSTASRPEAAERRRPRARPAQLRAGLVRRGRLPRRPGLPRVPPEGGARGPPLLVASPTHRGRSTARSSTTRRRPGAGRARTPRTSATSSRRRPRRRRGGPRRRRDVRLRALRPLVVRGGRLPRRRLPRARPSERPGPVPRRRGRPSTTSATLPGSPLPAGSWGRDGDFRVWENPETKEYWARSRRAEALLRRGLGARPAPPPRGAPAGAPPPGARTGPSSWRTARRATTPSGGSGSTPGRSRRSRLWRPAGAAHARRRPLPRPPRPPGPRLRARARRVSRRLPGRTSGPGAPT